MEWRPTAPLAALEFRARALARLRDFFAARNVLEVETPALSLAGVTDPALTSLCTTVRALGGARAYLQTSPEFPMKRLLAAGSGDIYQLCRVFRDDELGRWHQPEFTLLEWYRVAWNEHALMDEVEALIGSVLALNGQSYPSTRLSYGNALLEHAGVSASAATAELESALRAHEIPLPADTADAGLRDLLFSATVVPALRRDAITFIHDYPADQAALARIDPVSGNAARFEVFVNAVELGNGFAELTDAAEQRRRFERELERRRAAGQDTPPIDAALLAALGAGLPSCAGVAIGLDRLIAVAYGADRLDATMAFAHARE